MDFRFYLSLFLRRLPYFLLFVVVGSVMGVTLARLLPPVYLAEARLVVESEQIPDELAASTVRTQATEQLQIIQQRILTRDRLLEMANRLQIYAAVPGTSTRRLDPDEIVEDLRERIKIVTTGGGQAQATLVSVSFEAPVMSATVTNEVVTLILQENVAMRTTVAGQTLDFFMQEVARLDQELASQGAEILAFKTANKDALPESLDFLRTQQAAAQERLLQLDREEAVLKDRRTRLVQIYEQTGQIEAGPASTQTTEAKQLQENIEKHTWDGKWYRRAYFDDGEPLGSQLNLECQIDSLPQSWSIISGAGESSRSQEAMKSVDQRLIRRDAGLIQLFDPPFDKSSLNPGYIKGYIPGVRENGGQYTHGAIWTTMAFALMGENEKAWELFSLLNPIHHGGTPEKIETYKVEPYVVAADVYAVAPHVGRGGWTWYTGSAGWMYRLLIETLLGIHLEGSQLRLDPKMPESWPSFKIHYRFRQTVYHIMISRHLGDPIIPNAISVDGLNIEGATISLVDDQLEHIVEMKVS